MPVTAHVDCRVWAALTRLDQHLGPFLITYLFVCLSICLSIGLLCERPGWVSTGLERRIPRAVSCFLGVACPKLISS